MTRNILVAMKNFLILFQGREGSSPIISHLSRHPRVRVPLFEHLDRANVRQNVLDLDKNNSRIEDVLRFIYSSGAFSYEMFHPDYASPPENNKIRVGFKWRLWGSPEDIAKVLLDNQVLVYRLIRKNILSQCLSAYFSEKMLQKNKTSTIHPQFELMKMNKEAQKAYLDQIRNEQFTIDVQEIVGRLQSRIKSMKYSYNTHLRYLADSRVELKYIFYEDFLENSKLFLDSILSDLHLEPNPKVYQTQYKKVHRKDIFSQVKNIDEITASEQVNKTIDAWNRFIQKITTDVQQPDLAHQSIDNHSE